MSANITCNDEQSPLISVIVPAYNAEKYLERCIDSIRRQSYINLEIMIVDDGSSDGTGKLCDQFAKQDGRISVIHQDNMGASLARNNALKSVTGTYFLFVDADDYI